MTLTGTTVYGVKTGDVVVLNLVNTNTTETAVNIVTGAPIISGSIDRPYEFFTYGDYVASYPVATDDSLIWFFFDSYIDAELTLSFDIGVNVKYGSDLASLTSVNGINELKLTVENGVGYYLAIATADGSPADVGFSVTVGDNSGVIPDPDPGVGTDPNPGKTGLEGGFIATSVFNSNVRVLITSTSINIVDPEGRVITFTYTYVDGVFEVYYNGNKLPNSGDPEFTIENGVMTAIRNNGTDFTLTPTDEEIIIDKGNDEPVGSLYNPIVLETLPETLTVVSDTTEKTYYSFTATESGTLTFTWPSADSWVDIYELDASGNNTQNNSSTYLTSSFHFEIEEGKTYRFGLGTANKKGEFVITLAVS
jgi:hypothetical protein